MQGVEHTLVCARQRVAGLNMNAALCSRLLGRGSCISGSRHLGRASGDGGGKSVLPLAAATAASAIGMKASSRAYIE